MKDVDAWMLMRGKWISVCGEETLAVAFCGMVSDVIHGKFAYLVG